MVNGASVLASGVFFSVVLSVVGVLSCYASSYTTRVIGDDVIVMDGKTGLVWQQATADANNDGAISVAPVPAGDTMKWQAAVDYCEDLEYAGRGDWRLPEQKELLTLVDIVHSYPAIDKIFQCESHYYWTATIAEKDDKAWYIHFNYGSEHWKDKNKNAFVRCVSKK